MKHTNDVLTDSEDRISIKKEEDEIFLTMLKVVETEHDNINLLGTAAGMYWLGMSFGWKAFRVAHMRKILLNYKKLLITTHLLASFHHSDKDADLLSQQS
jgi:hypothetical protein